MVNGRALVLAAGLCLTISGCSGSIADALGFSKRAPDEFAVVKREPLIMPPDYDLRPPDPNARGPAPRRADARARAALTGVPVEQRTGTNTGAAGAASTAPSGSATGTAPSGLAGTASSGSAGTASSGAAGTAPSGAGTASAGAGSSGESFLVRRTAEVPVDPDVRAVLADEAGGSAEVDEELFERLTTGASGNGEQASTREVLTESGAADGAGDGTESAAADGTADGAESAAADGTGDDFMLIRRTSTPLEDL